MTRPAGVTLHATGDLMFFGPLAAQMAAHQDPLWAFRPLGSRLRECDVLFGNLETPISLVRRVFEGAHGCHSAPPGVARALREYGYSVVNLAHNHIYDFGAEGVELTLRELDECGLPYVGIGRTADEAARPALVTTPNGHRVGFLGYTTAHMALAPGHEYVACFPAPPRVAQDVRRLCEEADSVVVSCHMGAQYNPYPAPEARALARLAIEAGAALFLGHHPHVAQGLERIGSGLAAYSLGDFVAPLETEQTRRRFFLRAVLDGPAVTDFEQIPCCLAEDCQTALAEGPLREELLREFAGLSRAIAEGRSDELHFATARRRFFSQYVTSWWREYRRGGTRMLLRKVRNFRPYHAQLVWRLLFGWTRPRA